jgi:hypothetical protein
MDPATIAAIVAALDKIPFLAPVLVIAVPVITSIISICSLVATKLPAPTLSTGAYFWVYTIVNWGALSFGHAVSLSAPSSAGIVGGPTAIAAPQISIASVPMAVAEAYPGAIVAMAPPPVSKVEIPVPVMSVPPVLTQPVLVPSTPVFPVVPPVTK